MNRAVYGNAVTGLLRGRLGLVALLLALTLAWLQSMSLQNERQLLGGERAQLQAAERRSARPMVASGRARLTSAGYLAALKADSAATLREESLHYEALFLVFLSLFSLSAVFVRETARGGQERVLVAPVTRTNLAASLLGASFVFVQVCFTVLFAFLELRLHVFSGSPGLMLLKYVALTGMHVMILACGFVCHVAFSRTTALAAAAGLVFLGFGSYAIQIAGDTLSGPVLVFAGGLYRFAAPQIGTLFFAVLNAIRPGVYPGMGMDAAWIGSETIKTAMYFAAAFAAFNRRY